MGSGTVRFLGLAAAVTLCAAAVHGQSGQLAGLVPESDRAAYAEALSALDAARDANEDSVMSRMRWWLGWLDGSSEAAYPVPDERAASLASQASANVVSLVAKSARSSLDRILELSLGELGLPDYIVRLFPDLPKLDAEKRQRVAAAALTGSQRILLQTLAAIDPQSTLTTSWSIAGELREALLLDQPTGIRIPSAKAFSAAARLEASAGLPASRFLAMAEADGLDTFGYVVAFLRALPEPGRRALAGNGMLSFLEQRRILAYAYDPFLDGAYAWEALNAYAVWLSSFVRSSHDEASLLAALTTLPGANSLPNQLDPDSLARMENRMLELAELAALRLELEARIEARSWAQDKAGTLPEFRATVGRTPGHPLGFTLRLWLQTESGPLSVPWNKVRSSFELALRDAFGGILPLALYVDESGIRAGSGDAESDSGYVLYHSPAELGEAGVWLLSELTALEVGGNAGSIFIGAGRMAAEWAVVQGMTDGTAAAHARAWFEAMEAGS